jgi:hypothetical protein
VAGSFGSSRSSKTSDAQKLSTVCTICVKQSIIVQKLIRNRDMSKRVTVTLSDEVYAKLEEQANQELRPVSNLAAAILTTSMIKEPAKEKGRTN